MKRLRFSIDIAAPRERTAATMVLSRPMGGDAEITRLLAEWSNGNRAALDAVVPLVLPELRRIAATYLSRESHAQTLQTTALVHEAYLRLITVRSDGWETRTQFFALAAQIMRRILVDHARAQLGPRRAGRRRHVPLDHALSIPAPDMSDLIALDTALHRLEAMDARKSRVVELRLFGGLSHAEIAHALGVSERTAIREWQFAKAWLGRALDERVQNDETV